MLLQVFVIVMGLGGQILIARKDPRGYLAWIAGNLGLMAVYHQTQQPALLFLQVVNTAIQLCALASWRRNTARTRLTRLQPVTINIGSQRLRQHKFALGGG